jgi:hypothetical protein
MARRVARLSQGPRAALLAAEDVRAAGDSQRLVGNVVVPAVKD